MAQRHDLPRHAISNRRNSTKAEQLMWKLLRNKQLSELKFRRQHVIDPCVVNFACLSKKLIIEIDGGYHEMVGDKDESRLFILRSKGWQILRFTNEEVESNAECILAVIDRAAAEELMYSKVETRPSGMMKPRLRKDE